MNRRRWLAALTRTAATLTLPTSFALGLLGGGMRGSLAQDNVGKTILRTRATRSQFSPSQFEAKVGVALTLEIASVDFAHGFNMPDLKLRADLPPDTVTRIDLLFDKPGSYVFFCDNFCGDDHEDMFGKIVVSQ